MPFGNCSKLSRFSDCQDRFFFSFSAAFFFNTGNLVLIDFPFLFPFSLKKNLQSCCVEEGNDFLFRVPGKATILLVFFFALDLLYLCEA